MLYKHNFIKMLFFNMIQDIELSVTRYDNLYLYKETHVIITLDNYQ